MHRHCTPKKVILLILYTFFNSPISVRWNDEIIFYILRNVLFMNYSLS